MSEYTHHQKVHKLVDFLMGMQRSEPQELLAASGWSTEQLDRGWSLVMQAGRAPFSRERTEPDRAEAELLKFRKRWYPVVHLSLGERSPLIAALLLGSAYDPNTLGSAGLVVGPFLSILAQLETSADPQERAARQLLHERGLTSEVVAAAAQLVEQTQQLRVAKRSAALLQAAPQAEHELWAFYKEWSGLARRIITNRNLLRSLGLNKTGRHPRAQEKESALNENTIPEKELQKIGNAHSERPIIISEAAIGQQSPTTNLLKEHQS